MNAYHVLEMVGEGSYGKVYKGRKKFTGQVVALKFMPKVGRSDTELRSLKREIEIMTGLRHPNIVQLYDSFETKTEVVVVTEYAEGQLFQIIEDDGCLPESQVREIACQLVSALYYLHSHRILHRDMKPQNILLGKSGAVKLCDFGFARAMSVSTLVLTSIKGTPLYMSPELVEEKPYDHTADLWSLGCILYELHTGAPPFYANSIFQLVQLIIKDSIKWPDSMSATCTSFLKGLLTKDPQKRLSWPYLLHHPFVADGVLVLPDMTVDRPLTVTPTPDMLALKLQQVAEKTVPNLSGVSRLVRKAQQQEAANRGKLAGWDAERKKKADAGNERNSTPAAASPRTKTLTTDVSITPSPSLKSATNQSLHPKNQTSMKSKPRGQISIDYKREFPSVEVGQRLVQRCNEHVDSEDYWQKLAQDSDPSGRPQRPLNHSAIITQLKSNILAFKAQLRGGMITEQIYHLLRVLRNLILACDAENLDHIGCELGLPHILCHLILDVAEDPALSDQLWSLSVLGEMIVVLVIYWEKQHDWMEAEERLKEFTKPFITVLNQPDLIDLAPLAASGLSFFILQDVDVRVSMKILTSSLKYMLLNSYRPPVSLPSGWGLSDGLLSLVLHMLTKQHEHRSGSSGLDPELFLDLWKTIGSSLAGTETETEICSVNGLYPFLSAALLVLTKDPYSCIPLFSDCQSKCVYTLGRLLGTDCTHLFARGSPWRRDVDLSHDSLSALSCRLLCFPFKLDVPSHSMSTIVQLYDSCGVVVSLLQVIQTFPAPSLELPLSLLSRLLLCDRERFVSRLKEDARGFFMSPENSHPLATKNQAQLITRSASSLLSDLLQVEEEEEEEELWDSAVELLNLLSQVACCSAPPSCLQLHLEASVLHKALAHSYDQIRVATCRLLRHLDPFSPDRLHVLTPDLFRGMINGLSDSCLSVRQAACIAVGSWLGHIAAKVEFKVGEQEQNTRTCTDREAAGDFTTIAEHEIDVEEVSRWTEEARRTTAMFARLISDPDALIRRHCCASLGNLVNVGGAVPLLLKEDTANLLLQAVCTDSHSAVRQAAAETLHLYSQENTLRQVLISLNARGKLLEASQRFPPHVDNRRLIALLREPCVTSEGSHEDIITLIS